MARSLVFGLAGGRLARLAGSSAQRRAADAAPAGASGGVRTLLRLEGLAVLTVALAAYARAGEGWGFFAGLFLAPDLAFLAYLAGPRWGAIAYNAAHSYIGPLLLLAAGLIGATPWLLAVALVWSAHIGFDRALGYGLKYGTGSGMTHLGRVGRADPW